MEIIVSQMQGRIPVTVFQLRGELDAHFHEQLQKRADEAYQAGMKNLILDLSQVKYMSSSGLRALHHIFMLLRGDTPEESEIAMKKGISEGTFKSPHFKLANPSPIVLEALKTSGFDMFLEIHRNLKDALASF